MNGKIQNPERIRKRIAKEKLLEESVKDLGKRSKRCEQKDVQKPKEGKKKPKKSVWKERSDKKSVKPRKRLSQLRIKPKK